MLLPRVDQRGTAEAHHQYGRRGHHRDDPAQAEQPPACQPHSDDREHVDECHPERRPDVGLKLCKRSHHEDLERSEVVDRLLQDGPERRPRADERVVAREHVGGAGREVGRVVDRSPIRSERAPRRRR